MASQLKKHKCDDCGKAYTRGFSLRRHIYQMHENNKFPVSNTRKKKRVRKSKLALGKRSYSYMRNTKAKPRPSTSAFGSGEENGTEGQDSFEMHKDEATQGDQSVPEGLGTSTNSLDSSRELSDLENSVNFGKVVEISSMASPEDSFAVKSLNKNPSEDQDLPQTIDSPRESKKSEMSSPVNDSGSEVGNSAADEPRSMPLTLAECAANALTANQAENLRNLACTKEFCRLGCVCKSLKIPKRDRKHCGKPECMVQCCCSVPEHKPEEVTNPETGKIPRRPRQIPLRFRNPNFTLVGYNGTRIFSAATNQLEDENPNIQKAPTIRKRKIALKQKAAAKEKLVLAARKSPPKVKHVLKDNKPKIETETETFKTVIDTDEHNKARLVKISAKDFNLVRWNSVVLLDRIEIPPQTRTYCIDHNARDCPCIAENVTTKKVAIKPAVTKKPKAASVVPKNAASSNESADSEENYQRAEDRFSALVRNLKLLSELIREEKKENNDTELELNLREKSWKLVSWERFHTLYHNEKFQVRVLNRRRGPTVMVMKNSEILASDITIDVRDLLKQQGEKPGFLKELLEPLTACETEKRFAAIFSDGVKWELLGCLSIPASTVVQILHPRVFQARKTKPSTLAANKAAAAKRKILNTNGTPAPKRARKVLADYYDTDDPEPTLGTANEAQTESGTRVTLKQQLEYSRRLHVNMLERARQHLRNTLQKKSPQIVPKKVPRTTPVQILPKPVTPEDPLSNPGTTVTPASVQQSSSSAKETEKVVTQQSSAIPPYPVLSTGGFVPLTRLAQPSQLPENAIKGLIPGKNLFIIRTPVMNSSDVGKVLQVTMTKQTTQAQVGLPAKLVLQVANPAAKTSVPHTAPGTSGVASLPVTLSPGTPVPQTQSGTSVIGPGTGPNSRLSPNVMYAKFPLVKSITLQKVSTPEGTTAKRFKLHFPNCGDSPFYLPIVCDDDQWYVVEVQSIPQQGFALPPQNVRVPRVVFVGAITNSTGKPYRVAVQRKGDFELAPTVRSGFGILAFPEFREHIFIGPFSKDILKYRFESGVAILNISKLQMKAQNPN